MPNAAPPEMSTSIDEGKIIDRFYLQLSEAAEGYGRGLWLDPKFFVQTNIRPGKKCRATVREVRVRRSRKVVVVLEVL